MKAIRLLHPITHDGVHYGRGVYEGEDAIEDTIADALLAVHSPECKAFQPADRERKRPEKPAECLNHSAVPFVEQNPVKGKATPAVDARKAPPEANVPEVPVPDSSGPGKAMPAPDAQPKKKAS